MARRIVLSSVGYYPPSTLGYWVSPTGQASWQNALSDTPLSGAACAPLATALANASAGNSVYLRGGTYTQSLKPANSGTLENRITWMAYGSEVPTFTVRDNFRWAVWLDRVSCHRFINIQSYDSGLFFRIGYGSCYNEFDGCCFNYSTVPYIDYSTGLITGYNTSFTELLPSSHNYFHQCVFSRYGTIRDGDDKGTIYLSSGYLDPSSNNTFEDCDFFFGGHDSVCVLGPRNVLKNCRSHNEETFFIDPGDCVNSPSDSGYFGNRCVLIENCNTDRYGYTINYPGTAKHTLIEGCRIHHSGLPPDDFGANGIENAGVQTLIRYCDIFATAGTGVYFKAQPFPGDHPASGSTLEVSGSGGRVCHNTIFKTGIGQPRISSRSGVAVIGYANSEFWPWPADVKFKNNINYDWDNNEISYPIAPREYEIEYANNFNQNPLFVDTDTSDPFSQTKPDLRLQASSPCRNAAQPLTHADGGGSGVTLVVDDAKWFQDGTWGSALSHGVTHFPDWIAVGSVGNVSTVLSVDRDTNTITLASPLTWSDNDPVWIYRNASGERVLFGSAPDYGAHEYIE